MNSTQVFLSGRHGEAARERGHSHNSGQAEARLKQSQ